MKLILAVIQPEKLAAVQAALPPAGAHILSVSQVVGDGREPGLEEIYRGRSIRVPRPKLRVEILVSDARAQGVLEAVIRAGTPSDPRQIGHANALVLHLDKCVPIPDGEPGPAVTER
jgi:nitrogen regulatory protein P-II 1